MKKHVIRYSPRVLLVPAAALGLLLIVQAASGMGNKGVPPEAGGKASSGGSALDDANRVADQAATGQAIGEMGKFAQNAGDAVTPEMSNSALKKYAKSTGAPGLSAKNGSLQDFKKKALDKASGWQKLGKMLKTAGNAINIVSPVSRIAGHAWEGDWSGAGFAAVDEAGKKGATWGGGTAGTAVGGPVGSIVGAGVAEEVYKANVTPIINQEAQEYADSKNATSQYTPENYQRYQKMQEMKQKLSPAEYKKWLESQRRITQSTARSTAGAGRVVAPKRPCTCP